MRRLPARWTPHTVRVRPFEGVAGAGAIHGGQYTLPHVYVEDAREVIRASDGTEVVSSTRVICNFDDAPAEKSLITVWPGTSFEREAVAERISRFEHPNWPGYAEVRLV